MSMGHSTCSIEALAAALYATPGPFDPGWRDPEFRVGGWASIHPRTRDKFREYARRVLDPVGQMNEPEEGA